MLKAVEGISIRQISRITGMSSSVFYAFLTFFILNKAIFIKKIAFALKA